jgi:hypothetical protein
MTKGAIMTKSQTHQTENQGTAAHDDRSFFIGDSERVELQVEWMPPTTMATYEFLMFKGGADVWSVYNHLLYTARVQKTNQVWARDLYIKNGLKLSVKRLKLAKAFLHKHGYIDYIQRRDAKTGRMENVYIRVNFIATRRSTVKNVRKTIGSTGGPITGGAVNRWGGNEQQMLKESKEMLKESNQGLEESKETREENANSNKELIDRFNKETGYHLSFNTSLNTKLNKLRGDKLDILLAISKQISRTARNREAVLIHNLDKYDFTPKETEFACPACGEGTEYEQDCLRCLAVKGESIKTVRRNEAKKVSAPRTEKPVYLAISG